MCAPFLSKTLCVALLSLGISIGFGAPESTPSFASIAEKKYIAAGLRHQAEPKNVEAAWQFAKICFDWADLAPTNDQREKIAVDGIAAARRLISDKPRLAVAHYYLAMDLGQLARTKSIGALRIVDEMEREFKTVLELDSKLDFAGADRNLGMLYHEAPGWPASIGSAKKARHHLERSRELAPEFPDNHLYLLEAYLKWGDKKAAQREYDSLQKLWPEMKKQFTGDQCTRDWLDWDKRWKRVQDQFAE
jgi:tetratricopeptide (TPR) repeat protein